MAFTVFIILICNLFSVIFQTSTVTKRQKDKALSDNLAKNEFSRCFPILKIKIQQACKPGSVLPERSVCHLSRLYVTIKLQRFTPRHRASSPTTPVYITLQPVRRTAPYVAIRPGELLPRLFTLTACAAVIFCYVTPPSRAASR